VYLLIGGWRIGYTFTGLAGAADFSAPFNFGWYGIPSPTPLIRPKKIEKILLRKMCLLARSFCLVRGAIQLHAAREYDVTKTIVGPTVVIAAFTWLELGWGDPSARRFLERKKIENRQ